MYFYKFHIESVNYQKPTTIKILCNSINFQNVGTVNAKINNTTIAPGEFYNVAGNTGEVNEQDYRISFTNPSATENNVLVTTKIYIGLIEANKNL